MFDTLSTEARVLVQARLEPLQGTRFQPTGFPDLGAATYTLADGSRMCLVESAQSMANRLERAVWDEAAEDWIPPLRGVPYVVVEDEEGAPLTNSVLEAHRLNSPYILEGADRTFFDRLKDELGGLEMGKVDFQILAQVLFRYDPNSLVHGIFLAKKDLAGGRLRLARSLSAFVEARGVSLAASGGVKRDDVNPKGDTSKGFGHVPFHRDEYTGELTAYFSLDLAQIRGFRLGKAQEDFLVAFSLLKVRRLLRDSMRLRTACDLHPVRGLRVTRPEGYEIPSLEEIEEAMPGLIEAARNGFADPPITRVVYKG